ncbi:hypothetical protein [Tissierella sp.]|uniref:hypothetical protein n=1 Tax=Tissierella sp. TaxID=41274 RepID=UPI003F9B79AF
MVIYVLKNKIMTISNKYMIQFVLEEGVITLIGGIIGLLFGYGVAMIVGSFMHLQPILTF